MVKLIEVKLTKTEILKLWSLLELDLFTARIGENYKTIANKIVDNVNINARESEIFYFYFSEKEKCILKKYIKRKIIFLKNFTKNLSELKSILAKIQY